MTRVAVICHGNVCRSYLAEKIFAHHIPKVEWISAGVMPTDVGRGADPRARRALERAGYTDTGHLRRGISEAVLASRFVLVCQRNHREVFTALGCRAGAVRLVTKYDPLSDGDDVANPWGLGDYVFDRVVGLFERCVPKLRAELWAA